MLEGLVIWLLGFPAMKDLLVLFCRLTRTRPKNCCLEAIKNALALLLLAAPLCLLVAAYAVTRFPEVSYGTTATDRAVVFTCCLLVLSFCNCLLAFVFKALLRRPGW